MNATKRLALGLIHCRRAQKGDDSLKTPCACLALEPSCTPGICIAQFAWSSPYLLFSLVSNPSFLHTFRSSGSLSMLFLLHKCCFLRDNLQWPFNIKQNSQLLPLVVLRSSLLTLNTICHHIFICIYLSNPLDRRLMWSPTSIQHQLRTR